MILTSLRFCRSPRTNQAQFFWSVSGGLPFLLLVSYRQYGDRVFKTRIASSSLSKQASAFIFWHLIKALWKTWNSRFANCSQQIACFPVAFIMVSTIRTPIAPGNDPLDGVEVNLDSESLLSHMRLLYQDCPNGKETLHLRYFKSCSALTVKWAQYSTGIQASLGDFCRETHLNFLSPVSQLSVWCPFSLDSTDIFVVSTCCCHGTTKCTSTPIYPSTWKRGFITSFDLMKLWGGQSYEKVGRVCSIDRERFQDLS